jgi:uncharacterized protein YjbI with pentapeptide repeats
VDGSVYVCLDSEDYPDEEDATSAAWRATLWKVIKENATLVGAILALCGVLITQVISTRTAELARVQTAKLEDQRAKQTANLEDQRAQDSALQTYLGDMGDLLLNERLRNADPASELSQLARAKTLTVSLLLNAERKTILLVFLNEQDLITSKSRLGPVVSLQGADLSGADLSDMDLSYTDLSGTILADADLTDGPDYPDSFTGTIFTNANLEGVNFNGAKLRGANMEGANLTGATGISTEALQQVESLEGAILPNGQRYQDWLK